MGRGKTKYKVFFAERGVAGLIIILQAPGKIFIRRNTVTSKNTVLLSPALLTNSYTNRIKKV